MVQVQQQSLAAVKKSKAEEIVVDEGEHRPQDDVDEAETHRAPGNNHLRPERGVAIHVLDVVGERRVGMVQQSTVPDGCRLSVCLEIFVHTPVLVETCGSTSKEAYLAVGVKSSMANPSAQKEILARNGECHG